jgi:hypothetical protein
MEGLSPVSPIARARAARTPEAVTDLSKCLSLLADLLANRLSVPSLLSNCSLPVGDCGGVIVRRSAG